MELLDQIKNRRSIRKFKSKAISGENIQKILEAARWAPSGLNNQPWKFKILKEEKEKIADLTSSSKIIKDSDFCIAVFLDKDESYNRDKDLMAIGACIQNMLLESYSLGISSCWLGEILTKKDKFNKILSIPENCELTAVIAFGYPNENPVSDRKKIIELMIK